MIVNRYRYIEQLSRSKNNGLIKIITGLRRSGKSFLLKKLFHQHLLDEGVREDHILVIDMESRKNREFKNPDYLLDWVEKMMIDYETYYIIIDEVQEVEDFVEVLSSLSVTEGADVYVTGSNSRFLSSDLVTEFRGRGDEIHDCTEVCRNYLHRLGMRRRLISCVAFIARYIYVTSTSGTT